MKSIKEFEPIFGSWYIDELIGEGSYGKVYSAHRDNTGEREIAAIKHISIPPSEAAYRNLKIELNTENELYIRANLESSKDQVLAEYNMQRRFRGYTNFVDCQDIDIIPKDEGDIPGYDVFIRMERLTNLAEANVGKRMEPKEAAKLGIDVCRALELLKKENLVHRDLKPQNIFVSKNGDYKIGDFGIARELSSGSMMMTVVGTSGYMAPEIAKGENAGFEADIYSLGIVLYRQLTGYAPFMNTGKTSGSQITKAEISRLTGERIPDIAGVPEELNRIVLKACEYEKCSRYRNPTEMRRDLERFVEKLESDGEENLQAEHQIPEEDRPRKEETHEEVPETNGTMRRSTPIIGTQLIDKPEPETSLAVENHEATIGGKDKPKRKLRLSVVISAILCLVCLGLIGYIFLKPTPLTKDMSELSFSKAVYTGKTLTPAVTMIADGKELTQGKDYTISAPQSINVGEYELMITGMGRYSGSITQKYIIEAKDIAESDVAIVYQSVGVTYSGEAVTKTVESISYNGEKLVAGRDYIIDGVTSAKDVNADGGYELKIEGKGNYRGSVTSKWNINALDIADAIIEFGSAPVYNGEAQTISFTVSLNGVTLDPTKDYSVLSNSDTATNTKNQTLRIMGHGNYDGECEANWAIARLDIGNAVIRLEANPTFSAKQQKIGIMSVKLGEEKLYEGSNGYRIKDDSDMATDAGSYTVTLVGTGDYTGEVTQEYRILPKNLRDGIIVELSKAPIYNGKQQTQTVEHVFFGDIELTEGTDYEIKRGDKAIERTTDGYQLVIGGKGNYSGEKATSWNLGALTIAQAEVTFDGELVYNGEDQTAVYTVSLNGMLLEPERDYTVVNNSDTATKAEKHTLTIAGKGNYTGECMANWEIGKLSISNATVTLGRNLTYTGEAQTMNISSVRLGEDKLSEGINGYKIKNDSNVQTNAGTYTITLVGTGNYTGEATKEFKIAPKNMRDGITIELNSPAPYNGKQQTQTIKSVYYNGLELKENVDYTIKMGSNTAVDRSSNGYLLVISGMGNYTGDTAASWNIGAIDLSAAEIHVEGGLIYNGEAQIASYVVQLDETILVRDKDYAVVNASDTATGSGEHTLRIAGIANYAGECEAKWTIERLPINNATITLGKNPSYTGERQAISISSVKLGDSKLSEGSNGYMVKGDSNAATDVGTYTITLIGTGDYTGEVSKEYHIEPKNIKDGISITLNASPVYNGKKQTQTIKSVYFGDKALKENVDYKLVSGNTATNYSTNGYQLVINGIGNYTGEKSASWNIQKRSIENVEVKIVSAEVTKQGLWSIETSGIKLSVKDDEAGLLSTKDYEVYYAASKVNMDIKLGVFGVELTITGKNNYSGTTAAMRVDYTADRIKHQCSSGTYYYNDPKDKFCRGCGKELKPSGN